MLGLVNSLFSDFVIEQYNLKYWNDLLANCEIKSLGLYESAKQYSDEETIILVEGLAQIGHTSVADVLKQFGLFLYPHLMATKAGAKTESMDFWDFIANVPKTTHFKVRQSFPDASPPSFELLGQPGNMKFLYKSDRRLCFLAEGLLTAAAEARKCPVELKHAKCMHLGHDHCEIEIIQHAKSK